MSEDDQVEEHLLKTAEAFDKFHIASTIGDLADCESRLEPEQILQGFAGAFRAIGQRFAGGNSAVLSLLEARVSKIDNAFDDYWRYWLGLAQITGSITERNVPAGVRHLVAAIGYPSASLILGDICENDPEALRQSDSEDSAFWWYSLAAEYGWDAAERRRSVLSASVPETHQRQTHERVIRMLSNLDYFSAQYLVSKEWNMMRAKEYRAKALKKSLRRTV